MNSKFQKIYNAYMSLICEDDDKNFSSQQVDKVVEMINNNKKKSLKFKKQFSAFCKENSGLAFSKDDWDGKVKPALDEVSKKSKNWQFVQKKFADIMGRNEQPPYND